MKKITLTVLILAITFTLQAQHDNKKAFPLELPENPLSVAPLKNEAITESLQKENSQTYYVNGRELTFINIGTAESANSFQNKPSTILWADDYSNSIVLTYPLYDPDVPIVYSLSQNKGVNGSWEEGIAVYNDTMKPGRYAQGAIINQNHNSNPDDAIYTYLTPTQDGSNGAYGGYAYGINPLTQTNPPAPTLNHQTSSGEYYRGIPEAFTCTKEGNVFLADPCFENGQDSLFTGEFIIKKGSYSQVSGDIEYEEWLLPVLEAGDNINDTKIAFGPAGIYGSIMVLSNSQSGAIDYTQYHPIIYETTDGGETWSDEAIHCQLGGPEGIDEIKQFIPDDSLAVLFGPDFNRDSIQYNLGYHADMVIDLWGNIHIIGLIAPANNTSWFPLKGYMGTFHLFYDGISWNAHLLYMNNTFEGDLGGMSMYNNPRISTDVYGSHVFFMWNDSNWENFYSNVAPDIYFTHYDPYGYYGEVTNVTSFTQAMWTAYWLESSYYVFTECINGYQIFTIPMLYKEIDPNDPYTLTRLWYIDGFTLQRGYCTGIPEESSANTSVKQNKPNPFSSISSIEVETRNYCALKCIIRSSLGRKLMEINKGNVEAGLHTFEISAKNLSKGVYFYSIYTDDQCITKKMIVE